MAIARHGAGWVELPNALTRTYPNAGRDWGWQWVFPATRMYVDRLTAQRLAVYHGKGTKVCPARSGKHGCGRNSAGLVRRAIQNYAAGYRSSRY
jgi:hypothetical protein